jgi:ferredoxin
MFAKLFKSVTNTLGKIWFDKIQPVIREMYFDERFMSLIGRKPFELSRFFFKFDPISKRLHLNIPAFDPAKSNLSWLPINETIEGLGEMTLSEEVLNRFIEKASHRVIINFCGCRTCCKCEHYPQSIGCLMMGETALLIPEKSRKEVSVEEAKAHVRNAMQAGLIPITGKARIDNDMLQLPDNGKLLTVCFCCECCCIARFNRYVKPEDLGKTLHPVEGLSIEVSDDCVGCGLCVSKCYIGAIQIVNDRAEISDLCRICGRCATHCPSQAIKLKLANAHAVDDVVKRIESVIDF